jgi:sugar lactone lactonase YvrE
LALSIGRANLDGTGVDQSFVPTASAAYGVAVDGAHVYWVNGGSTTIGRANLDGSGINQAFISGATTPRGPAVDGAHVYWANRDSGTIGRANLDGSNPDQSFIAGADFPRGVAVDGAHVYWTNRDTGTIGRANLDGSNPDQSFITSANSPFGLAVDGAHLYWANNGNGRIGRANLDGSAVNQSFITGATFPFGVAVDSPPGLSPAGLGFGSAGSPLPQGTVSAPQSVTITNTGALPLVISGFSIGGADPGDFFVSNDTCHAPLPSNVSCTVQARFTPQAQGDRSAIFSVESNEAPPTPVALSGTAGPLPQGATGPQGPPGRDAKVRCKVKKRKTKVKVICKVRLVSGTARLHWRLTRHRRTFARGVAVVRHGRAAVSLPGDLPEGRYALHISGRKHAIPIAIG